MKTINGKKINEKLRVYVNGKRKTSGGGAPPSLYQEWAGYPDSPVLTADYPYQFITSAADTFVMVSTGRYYVGSSYLRAELDSYNPAGMYLLSAGSWHYIADIGATQAIDLVTSLKENNCPIYTDNTYTTVAYAKTTP